MTFAVSVRGVTQEANLLILEDIGVFRLERESREFSDRKLRAITPYKKYNGSAGIVGGAGHFAYDHNDVTYETGYDNSTFGMGVSVQVVKHSGSDSDKWLLHEVEDSYRSNDKLRLGLLSTGAVIKRLVANGDRFFSIRLGGGTYMWLSNNVVVNISFVDLNGGKPEPVEVIQAYLQKFPSTIPSSLVLDKAHDIQWIKDEMERRLWLGDKWFYQLQLGKVQHRRISLSEQRHEH